VKDDLKQQIAQLNQEVEDAESRRDHWFGQHLAELAEFQPGDRIYAKVAANDYKLQFAGVVTEIVLKTYPHAQPELVYRFTPDPSYHYGRDTDKAYTFFFNHENWIYEQRAKIQRLQWELETAGKELTK
jgi:hypothetical protein